MRNKILFAVAITVIATALFIAAMPLQPLNAQQAAAVFQATAAPTKPITATVIVSPTIAPLPTPQVSGKPGVFASIAVTTTPTLDGNANDAVWQNAPATILDVATVGNPPYKILMKSVYDDKNVYFLVQYPDMNMDVDRHEWAYNAEKKAWEILSDDYGDEDEFGFFWNNNIPNYDKTGCLTSCHGDKMVAPKGAWTDDWRFNTTRANPMGWARDFHFTDDETADPSGGFTKDEGYSTNRGYADNTQKIGDADVPLYWKPYSGAGGVAVGDPRYILQSEIDAGFVKKIVKVETDGTLVDEAGNKVPSFTHIPGWILSAPSGPSWNDIQAKGNWLNGVWTVELARKLNTGNKDDVQFETGKDYFFDMYIKSRQPNEGGPHATVLVAKFNLAK